MLRFAAAMAVLMSSLTAGRVISAYLQKRISELERFIRLTEGIKDEIRYTCCPLEEIIPRVSGRVFNTQQNYFSFEAVISAFSEHLLKSDKKELLFFFSSLGSGDCESQLNRCDMELRVLEDIRERAEEERKKYSGIIGASGIFAGMLVLIFVL